MGHSEIRITLTYDAYSAFRNLAHPYEHAEISHHIIINQLHKSLKGTEAKKGLFKCSVDPKIKHNLFTLCFIPT